MNSEDRIRNLLSRKLAVDPSQIRLNTVLQKEFGLDFVSWLDLMISLEDEFDLDIPDRKLDEFRTFGQIVKYMNSRIG